MSEDQPDREPAIDPDEQPAAPDDSADWRDAGAPARADAQAEDAAFAPPGVDGPRVEVDRPDAFEAVPEPRYADPYAADYADVPASLEMAYTTADLGLSPNAYERSFPYEKRRRKVAGARAARVGRELAEIAILAALIFFAVSGVIQNFRVEGSSMEPSLSGQQYLLVNKAIYFRVNMDRIHSVLPFIPGDDGRDRHIFRAPRRGDVIVFKYPQDPNRDFIKRVIGVPGDTVEVRDGTVFINGAPLVEDYILATPNYVYGPKVVPERHYFVLGDNRRNSFDSHAWGASCSDAQMCDFVPEENIIGQAWVTYWPLDQLDFINNKILRPGTP